MENHQQIYTFQHSVRHKDNWEKSANLTKICQIKNKSNLYNNRKKQNLINSKKKNVGIEEP